MLKEMLDNVRETCPLIHNITNFVTVNDCANVLLACGASPIMANDAAEVEEITAFCAGLNINMGTLSQQTIPSMFKAGKRANALHHPIVLDPVGVGASALRTDTALQLLEDIHFSVIRGNISELRTLALGDGNENGVDAAPVDAVTKENLAEAVSFVQAYAKKTGAVIAVTGTIDIVADANKAYCIYNGHPRMRSITGTGCQLSAMTAAYIAANPEQTLEAAAAAVCAMGICGEKAAERMGALDGNASFRIYMMDAVSNLSGDELEKLARYEIYPSTSFSK